MPCYMQVHTLSTNLANQFNMTWIKSTPHCAAWLISIQITVISVKDSDSQRGILGNCSLQYNIYTVPQHHSKMMVCVPAYVTAKMVDRELDETFGFSQV